MINDKLHVIDVPIGKVGTFSFNTDTKTKKELHSGALTACFNSLKSLASRMLSKEDTCSLNTAVVATDTDANLGALMKNSKKLLHESKNESENDMNNGYNNVV